MVFSVPCITAFLFGYWNTWTSQCLLSGMSTGINSLFRRGVKEEILNICLNLYSKCIFCCCYINVLHCRIYGGVYETQRVAWKGFSPDLNLPVNSNLCYLCNILKRSDTLQSENMHSFLENCRQSDFLVMDSLCKMSIISFWDHLFRQLIVTYSSYDFVFQEETESSCCSDGIIENTNDCSACWI